MEYKKGDIVYIKDFPLGKALDVCGEIIGFLGDDHYNIRLLNGFNEGTIVKYKYWKLCRVEEGKKKIVFE